MIFTYCDEFSSHYISLFVNVSGDACETLDCPGDPDCNGVEHECVLYDLSIGPVCRNCTHPYVGDACTQTCWNGTAELVPIEDDTGTVRSDCFFMYKLLCGQ